jgi:phosphate transport system protein
LQQQDSAPESNYQTSDLQEIIIRFGEKIFAKMNTKREESIKDVVKSFEEMSDVVLAQLILLEKYMALPPDPDFHNILEEIRKNEDKVDKYEVIISDKVISSIVLYQPVASDIRKLIAIYRMTINLERIGDLVLNIIGSVDSIKDTAEYKAMTEVIMNMLLSGISMVEKSLLSFINSDTEYAVWTIKNDEVVDEMNRKLLINSIKKANVSEKTRELLMSYADLKNIITNLERVADHATNIAEASIYSLQGTDIRHSGLDLNKNDITGNH